MSVPLPYFEPRRWSVPRFLLDWPYNVEEASTNNKYLVRKSGTDQTKVLHRLQLRLFIPKKPIPSVQTASQKSKSDPEVMNKHDDLYAKAWESEFGNPIFDNDQYDPRPLNRREVTKESVNTNTETRCRPGSTQERCVDFFPPTDGLWGGKDR